MNAAVLKLHKIQGNIFSDTHFEFSFYGCFGRLRLLLNIVFLECFICFIYLRCEPSSYEYSGKCSEEYLNLYPLSISQSIFEINLR